MNDIQQNSIFSYSEECFYWSVGCCSCDIVLPCGHGETDALNYCQNIQMNDIQQNNILSYSEKWFINCSVGLIVLGSWWHFKLAP